MTDLVKIISVNNYNREGPGHDDKHVVTMHFKPFAEKVANLLNEDSGPNSQRYYRVVPSNYKLQVFEP